ncbi:MAG: helix-hairpin-helix domain-containing protein [Bacteroidales bacterium]|nr:helix-hairpin-helix domain-containing protein [Bacteroidales bacterium]
MASTLIFSQELTMEIPGLDDFRLPTVSEEEQASEVFDLLAAEIEWLKENPININTASRNELEKLFMLTSFQVHSLLEYRKTVGTINSLYELNYIYGFDIHTTSLIAPFVATGENKLNEPIIANKNDIKFKNVLLMRSGYKSNVKNNYAGSPLSAYFKLKGINENSIRYCFQGEKDAGEEFFSGSNSQGFDFNSAFIQIWAKTKKRKIIIGDYKVKSGQGLLIWNGFSPYKGAQSAGTIKRNQGIDGNNSKDEYNFLRGAAIECSLKKQKLYFYVSKKQIDVIADSLARNVSTSGYHRTNTEILRKNNAGELATGAMLRHEGKHLNAGLNWIYTRYNVPFQPSAEPYQVYSLFGSSVSGLSADYRLLYQKLQLFGEAAVSNSVPAIVNGVNMLVSPSLTTTLSYRHYPEGYFAPYSNALSENSRATNEQAVLTGFVWKTPWKTTLTAYSDIFSFPWLSYYTDRPLRGHEQFAELAYSPVTGTVFDILYRSEIKDKNTPEAEAATNHIKAFKRQNLRLQIKSDLAECLKTIARFEWCQAGFVDGEQQNGYLLFTDFGYKLPAGTIFSFRYTFFNTQAYDTRIYAFETDVLYTFTVPAYYGNGHKIYLMARQPLTDKFTLWFRYEKLKRFDDASKNYHGLNAQLILSF